MSYDWSDAAYDEAMDNLYEDFAKTAHEDDRIYDRIVEQFKDSRLCAFYVEHPDISKAARDMLSEAMKLKDESSRSSLIMAAAASEICLRDALLTPIIYGSFHSDSSGDLIASLIVDTKNNRVIKALLDIFARHTGIELRQYVRSGSAKTLWQELNEMRRIRNAILHRGDGAAYEEAVLSIEAADCLLNLIFPHTLTKLGLHLHGGTICGSSTCPAERDHY